jgi:ketosteroid isomerase-like protein
MSILLILAAAATQPNDRDAVAELDRTYQAAVKRNDAAAMDRIFHPDFQLVVGTGRRSNRQDLLREARSGSIVYEVQDEEPGTQTVLITGDTAIVTAKLRIKGTIKGTPMDRTLWFSDTYVRTPTGWRYFFGQASLPLPTAQD